MKLYTFYYENIAGVMWGGSGRVSCWEHYTEIKADSTAGQVRSGILDLGSTASILELFLDLQSLPLKAVACRV